MNKKSLFIFSGILTILMMVSLASCDSLWKVQEGFSVTMNINLQELAGGDDYAPIYSHTRASSAQTPSLIDGDDDDTDFPFFYEDRLTVTLYNANTDNEIASQDYIIDSEAEMFEANVSFGQIPKWTRLYATVVVERRIDYSFVRIFESRSPAVSITENNMNVVTYPNIAFLDYERGASQNTSSNAGLTSTNPATRLEDALKILRRSGSYLENATIYVMQSINVENSDSDFGSSASDGGRLLDFGGLTMRRLEPTYPIFSVSDGNKLTLQNIVLEGDENAIAPLLSVEGMNPSSAESSVLTLLNGVYVQNNINVYYSDAGEATSGTGGIDVLYGAKLILNGATIRNNEAYESSSTAGINSTGIVELAGGTIIIDSNVNHDRMHSNFAFYSMPSIPSVVDFPVQVTGNLNAASRIGLNVQAEEDAVIVMKNGGTINPNNFFMDYGNSIALNNDGHLISIPQKTIYIGGSNSNDSNNGLSEQKPIKTFARAKQLFDGESGKLFFVGTVEVSGNETWAPNDGQQIEVHIIDPLDETLVHVKQSGTLTLQNQSIHPSGGGLSSDNALVTVEGTLLLKGDITIYNNGGSYNLWDRGSIELVGNGKLELYDGYKDLGHGIRYVHNTNSSPISVHGTFGQDTRNNNSNIQLRPRDEPKVGDVLVEKGENIIKVGDLIIKFDDIAIEPRDYGIDSHSGWTGVEYAFLGEELNSDGNLAYVTLVTDIYIDGAKGKDTNYGTKSAPVKTFERAYQLVLKRLTSGHGLAADVVTTDGTIWVTNTITVQGHETWDTSGDITLKRAPGFEGSLITVNTGATLTVPNTYGNLIIDGNMGSLEATKPLISVNGGTVEFLEGNDVVLRKNNNIEGAGAIHLNGGSVTLAKTGIYTSNDGPPVTVIANTSKEGFAAITATNGARVVLNGGVVYNNAGGGIHIDSNSRLMLAGEASVINNTGGAGAQNITFEEPSNELDYGIFIYQTLTSQTDSVIGITVPDFAEEGYPLAKKFTLAFYHPKRSSDFLKFFRDDGGNLEFNDTAGEVRMPQ